MWMRSSRVWMSGWDLAELWMRSSQVVRASDSQCRSCNCPGFDPPTQWNLGGGRWSSVELILKKSNNIKSPFSVVWLRDLWGFREVQAGASPEEAPDRPGCVRGAHREEEPWRGFHQGSSRLEAFYQLSLYDRASEIIPKKAVMGRKIYFHHKLCEIKFII